MRSLSLVVGIVVLTALACSDPASRLPTSPSEPGVTSLEISGPSSIGPGQSAQIVATIRLADGTSKLPSSGTPLYWSSSNTAVLRVNAEGLATAQQPGDARITVLYGTGRAARQAIREFVVVPHGTFRLTGVITEADLPSVPVIDARVTVAPGSLSTVTGADGRYQLYGVPADAVVTITKTGFTTISQGIQLTSHTNRNFSLALDGPRLTIAGPYTLTIDLAGSCSSAVPLSLSLQRRTYEAVIAQNGPELTVVLTEARFSTNAEGRGNKFAGRAGTDGATFLLDSYVPYSYYYYYFSYPSVAERLLDSTILVPHGTVTTTGSAAGLSGSMAGSIHLWSASFPGFNTVPMSYCISSSAQFTLTPR